MPKDEQDCAWLRGAVRDQMLSTLHRWLTSYSRLGDTRQANIVQAEIDRRATGAPVETDDDPAPLTP